MNPCPDGERLQAWMDGRLPPADAERVRTHSAGCPACGASAEGYRRWTGRLQALPRPRADSPCPPPDVLAALAAGSTSNPSRAEVLVHLESCAECRDDVLESRALLAQKTPSERVRLRRRPRPARPYGWIAAAATLLVSIGVGWSLASRRSPDADLVKPSSKPKPAVPTPVAPVPPPPEPSRGTPAPKPQPPPAVVPEAPRPDPEKPAPPPPAVAKPAPEPERPSPPKPPDKPAPVVTRPKLRGTLTAVAGSCSIQLEGEAAWQPGRIAQARDFTGTVKVKADVSASKVRVSGNTFWLQRGTELALSLEEGRTFVRLAKGDAGFDIIPGKAAFEVESPWGTVTVRGTRFVVSAEKTETEVLVLKGKVDFAAGGQSVSISAGERSVASAGRNPAPAARADVAKRLPWIRALEEILAIEAEQLVPQQGMAPVADAAASGGRALAAKVPVPAGQEPSAEIRVRRKQAVPYAVWVRLHWSHGVASAAAVQVHDAARWTATHVAANPAWQWVKLGVYDLPDEAFRLRLVDPQGGMRFDQILFTSDLEFDPDVDKR